MDLQAYASPDFGSIVLSHMPVTESRFHNLERRVNEIAERLAKIEGGHVAPQSQRGEWKTWLPIGAPLVALLAVVVTVAIHFDNKLTTMQTDLQAMRTRLEKVEAAVKVLGEGQKNSIKQIIHDLLAAAKTGDPEVAARSMQTVASLTDVLRRDNQPADTGFFKQTFEDVQSLEKSHDQPSVRAVAFRVQKQLAEYRSAIDWIEGKYAGRPDDQAAVEFAMTLVGVDMTGCPPGAKENPAIVLPSPPNPEHHTIGRVAIVNCPEVLDGRVWIDVVFVNSRIKYNGGPLVLRNVRFVHCTFDAPQNDLGSKLFQYATLQQPILEIRPELIEGPRPQG